MFQLISKLHDIADDLEDHGKDDLAENIDKIACFLIESYKKRIQRQRKSRGVEKFKRKRRWTKIRSKDKRRQRIYRRKYKTLLKNRKKLRHYPRRFMPEKDRRDNPSYGKKYPTKWEKMDAIQKVLVKAGRKDLAKKYYKKITASVGSEFVIAAEPADGGRFQISYVSGSGKKHEGPVIRVQDWSSIQDNIIDILKKF